VDSGEIGRPCVLRITSRDPELPAMEFLRVSGGMFLDMSIHDFDMARFLIGEVEEIYAVGSVLVAPELNEIGDIDTNIINLKFTNGTLGTIDNSRQAVYGYDQRLEVFCSNGIAMAGNETENTTVMANPAGFHASRIPHFFMQRYAPCYVEEVRQFIECVRENKPTPVTGLDGRMAVVLGMVANKSLRENRSVKVSEISGR
jgi:myo-inositol 2-dehydrogenase/D-chiro-inositol 1-dehydrogenase